MDFIGREADLAFFERCYARPGAQLVFLYGRRRVGKTELLYRFSQGKPCVRYTCTKEPDARQLRAFSGRLLAHVPSAARLVDSFSSWRQAFEHIPELDIPGKKLVLIDEFPYAVAGNAALPSILQSVWDETLSREDVMVVLCGSSIGFMEDELLSEKNPLYGRATGVWNMGPLSFQEAARFFPEYSPQEKLEAYGILGGVPHYLNQFDGSLSIGRNVCENILTRGCALYSEADFLLREELREPAVYNAVLGAVATGETELGGVASKALVESRTANTYLTRLRQLRLVDKEFSVQAGRQERSKQSRGLWRISDNFLRFWYAAAQPYVSDLEMGGQQAVWDDFIEPNLNMLLSKPFEDVCRQWVRRLNAQGELPFRAKSIGRWWQGADEVDVAALGPAHAHLLGECKFTNAQVGPGVLHSLADKESAHFPQGDGRLWLFAKSGFTPDETWAGEDLSRVRLVTPEDLCSASCAGR